MNGEFLVRTPVPTDRANIVQRGRKLQYLTIAWNSLECVIALVAGFLAGSIALIGFGFDSAIEVTSSLAALWRLRQDRDEDTRVAAERRASQVIGACFLLLAVYVLYEALDSIIEQLPPDHSLIGIGLAALSLIVMPWLDDQRQGSQRSEEHTSELQSLAYLVCRLLLEKKKKIVSDVCPQL